ncbi:DUF362 domain-containing protein [Desulfosediminicola ganghwensis]|uniref:DUF362 domain-containing protein n=1 Tax=Desulfosediminicola ganghwensis TaxID=2569540 RepID=UPI0010ACD3B5|nr:DUF362 domain-containing protein [Desulfosediminicola ganghwensis]
MYSVRNTICNRVYSTAIARDHGNVQRSVDRLLAETDLADRLKAVTTVLIKPNLVEALEPPITTPVALIEALVCHLRAISPHLEIMVGEGTGSTDYDTYHCFETLGYTGMAAKQGIELVDLNPLPSTRLADKRCRRWPEMYLPKLLDDIFLLSVPVLKAHSLAGVTLTMKNMMGCAPPEHYQQGGHWGKSSFHERMQESVFDLNCYRTPDFTLMDATVGMSQAHLWGPHCDPPVGRIVASADPVSIDMYGCQLLGKDWRQIDHIAMAHVLRDSQEEYELVEV